MSHCDKNCPIQNYREKNYVLYSCFIFSSPQKFDLKFLATNSVNISEHRHSTEFVEECSCSPKYQWAPKDEFLWG